jgi:hypothetical protein
MKELKYNAGGNMREGNIHYRKKKRQQSKYKRNREEVSQLEKQNRQT